MFLQLIRKLGAVGRNQSRLAMYIAYIHEHRRNEPTFQKTHSILYIFILSADIGPINTMPCCWLFSVA